jgi:hypothetical protein
MIDLPIALELRRNGEFSILVAGEFLLPIFLFFVLSFDALPDSFPERIMNGKLFPTFLYQILSRTSLKF